jgi:uncharacterized protein (TIGR03435 family)
MGTLKCLFRPMLAILITFCAWSQNRQPMPPDAQPAFDVATIKPTAPDAQKHFISMGRGGSNLFSSSGQSVKQLIAFSYAVHPNQVVGGPAWADNDRYDVTGKPDAPGLPSIAQFQGMVRKLLTNRFGLTFHREKKEVAVYAITIANGGAKIPKSDNSSMYPVFVNGGPPGALVVRNMSMTSFAEYVQARYLDKPVVDQTGLDGRYDFQLHWQPALTADTPQSDADTLPDIFAAFRQQLGLKLQATRAPADTLVIDKVEKPGSN